MNLHRDDQRNQWWDVPQHRDTEAHRLDRIMRLCDLGESVTVVATHESYRAFRFHTPVIPHHAKRKAVTL